jgi:hypothetical protein
VYLALAKSKLGGRFPLNGYRAGYMLCLTVALVLCPDAMSCAPELVFNVAMTWRRHGGDDPCGLRVVSACEIMYLSSVPCL